MDGRAREESRHIPRQRRPATKERGANPRKGITPSGRNTSWNWCACAILPIQHKVDLQHSTFLLLTYCRCLFIKVCVENFQNLGRSMSYAFSIAMHCVCLQAGRPKWVRAQDPKHRINYARPKIIAPFCFHPVSCTQTLKTHISQGKLPMFWGSWCAGDWVETKWAVILFCCGYCIHQCRIFLWPRKIVVGQGNPTDFGISESWADWVESHVSIYKSINFDLHMVFAWNTYLEILFQIIHTRKSKQNES
jgi:hypothetical protein